MRAALIAAIVTQVAVTTTVLLWRAPPTTVVESHHAAPITLSFPITIEAPLPSPLPAATPRASCPLPRTDAPRAKRVDAPKDVNRVTPSRTNAGWIAAWDEQHMMLSTDAGLSFARVMDGPGDIEAVTFDCFGALLVVRGDQLGIREGSRERWQRLPPGLRGLADDPVALIGGGPDVIVIGIAPGDTWQARIAVSADRGSSWWYRDLVDYWESSDANGYQASDGSIHVALTTADCMSDPVFWFRIRDGKLEQDDLGNVGDIVLDRDRAYVGRMGDDDADPREKRFGEADWRPADKRGRKLLRGEVDAAGRVWTIDETIDGEAAWAEVAD